MSFGYGVGDCLAVATLAWQVYKSCRDAPESFSNIQVEILSLHAVLKEVEETLPDQQLTTSRQHSLATISQGCEAVLRDLQALVGKYESLGSKSKRTWDRMKWSSTEVAELRARLTSNTVLLTAFMSTSQITVARQLNKLVQEFQEGKHEGSVLTVATVESLSLDEKQTWRAIRKELEDIGISVAAFDANKGFIMNWFQEALETGKFEEQNQECADDGQQQGPLDGATTATFQTPPRTEDLGGSSRDWGEATSMIYQEEVRGSNTTEPTTSRPNSTPSDPSVVPTKPVNGYKKGLSDRRRPPQVALLVAWMLRYDKAFHTACINGRLDKAQLLLDKGANINSISSYETPLTFAASHNRMDLLRFLLAAGADIEWRNAAGRTPLHEAIHHGNVKSKDYCLANIEHLLNHGAKVDGLDLKSRTPFQRASDMGYTAAVALLFEYGMKIPFATEHGSEAPLPFAIRTGNIAMTTLLLDHCASINSMIIRPPYKDAINYGLQPILNYAIILGQDEIALLIVKRGAVIVRYTGANTVIIIQAIKHDCVQTLRHLVSMFPSEVAATTRDQNDFVAPLAYAVERENVVCCKVLINGGAKLRETYLDQKNRGFRDTKASSWDVLDLELQKEPGKWPSIYSIYGGRNVHLWGSNVNVGA